MTEQKIVQRISAGSTWYLQNGVKFFVVGQKRYNNI